MVCLRVFVFWFASFFFGNGCFFCCKVICVCSFLQCFCLRFLFCKEFCVFFQVFFSLDSVIYFCKWLCVFFAKRFCVSTCFLLSVISFNTGFCVVVLAGVSVIARGCCCFFKALFFHRFSHFSTIFHFQSIFCVNSCEHTLAVLVLRTFCTCRALRLLRFFSHGVRCVKPPCTPVPV